MASLASTNPVFRLLLIALFFALMTEFISIRKQEGITNLKNSSSLKFDAPRNNPKEFERIQQTNNDDNNVVFVSENTAADEDNGNATASAIGIVTNRCDMKTPGLSKAEHKMRGSRWRVNIKAGKKEKRSGQSPRWRLTKAISDTSAAYLGSKLDLPLKGPPYYIVQHGMFRSGSTFQFHLLQAIVDLKSKGSSRRSPSVFLNSPVLGYWKIIRSKHQSLVYQGQEVFEDIVDDGFVQKSHLDEFVGKTTCELSELDKQVAVFVSVIGENMSGGDDNGTQAEAKDKNNHLRAILAPLAITYDTGYIAHVQEMNSADFRNCPSCQIETHYKDLFDLSDREIKILKDYTEQYSIVRKCCGSQMSKYNRLRLHGCDVSKYKRNANSLHNYPWCESHDLPEIESSFAHLVDQHGLRRPENSTGWSTPGDCAISELRIRGGEDFNNRKWDGKCTLESVNTAD